MVVDYELTADDLKAFNLYHQSQSPAARRQYYRAWLFPAAVLFLVCLALWLLVVQQRGAPWSAFRDMLPLFLAVPAYLLYFPWAYRRKVRKIVEGMISEGHNRRLFGPHRVTLSEEGILESGEFGYAMTVWAAVERVSSNADYAFVYTSALGGIIVPRRAFASPSDFDQFLKTATDFRKNAVFIPE